MFLDKSQFGHLKNGDLHLLLRVFESMKVFSFDKYPPTFCPVLFILCHQPVSSPLMDSKLFESRNRVLLTFNTPLRRGGG